MRVDTLTEINVVIDGKIHTNSSKKIYRFYIL